MAGDLPVLEVLPQLRDALKGSGAAVLIAPPGAGKTTAVPPALIEERWCDGEVLVLSPRRVAARAAAERMAELHGEAVGQRFGYATRLDSKRSPRTRVTVMTEAIYVARLIADPDLAGVSAVVFDEAHERTLDSDLALALTLESRSVLRPDLRVLVMSATIAGERFASLLGGVPLIESAGRAHPLEIRWLGSRPGVPVHEQMVSAIGRAWEEEPGEVLAFVPSVRDVDRTVEQVRSRLPAALVLPLHGQVEPAEQRRALRRDPRGLRRIVVATNIAETSLTLDGVSVVVDSGLARQAQFDRQTGFAHLVTRPASRASTDQRAGRAARQGPGVAYRLWEAAGHSGRPDYDTPEILVAELSSVALTLAAWGAGEGADLHWLDPPPVAAMRIAIEQLRILGAVDDNGAITPHGRAVAALPMNPAIAHMMIAASRSGQQGEAAELALLMQERGLGGADIDLSLRMSRWRSDRGRRASSARSLSSRWARMVDRPDGPPRDTVTTAVLMAEGLPGKIARRRDKNGENWLSADGRGYRMDPAASLASKEWIVIADAQGDAREPRITSALALAEEDVANHLRHLISQAKAVRWIDGEERAELVVEQRIGKIVLSRQQQPVADQPEVIDRLVEHFRRTGVVALPFSPASRALLSRATYCGLDALSEQALSEAIGEWLTPLLGRVSSLRDLSPARLHDALLGRLSWTDRELLDRTAPSRFIAPSGSEHEIDYLNPAGPTVEVRVQALFGLDRHPVAGTVPLILKLTSPAGRPLQSTSDLPAFWRGSWRDVVKDMKGRYPKHRWPDEPWAEIPSLKTKNAFDKSRGP